MLFGFILLGDRFVCIDDALYDLHYVETTYHLFNFKMTFFPEVGVMPRKLQVAVA